MSAEQKWTPMRLVADEKFPWALRLVCGDSELCRVERVAYSTRAKSIDQVRDAVGTPRDEVVAIRAQIASQEEALNRVAACWNYLANIPTEKLHGTLLDRLMSVEAERDRAMWLLRQILTDLPTSRDWLDPAVEREARALIKDTTP